MWTRAALALTLFSLAGCVVGPKYHQPVPPVPAQFKEGGTPESGTPDIAYSDWWRVFNEPDLARLETEADAANQDIKLAVARVDQAEAGSKYARSFLFPTISLGASASRTREAQNRPNNGNTNGLAATFNDFQLPAFLSYEVDAWGRVRHSIEAANAQEKATDASLSFCVPRSPYDGLPPSIPSGLPAELLARRPDIAEVERYVAAANAEIGVAKTAALPHISLTGFAGFESVSMTSLFSWQNGIASLAASAITPIFTGGRVKAGVDQAWAMYRQSLAQYQKTVLVAYQEVEDQLAALRILAGEAESTTDAVADAEQAETIALNRYRNGLVSYLDVVYAQTALLANQRTATQIGGQRMVATVVLIKALGGGWLGVPAPAGTNPNPGAPGSTSATNQPAM